MQATEGANWRVRVGLFSFIFSVYTMLILSVGLLNILALESLYVP